MRLFIKKKKENSLCQKKNKKTVQFDKVMYQYRNERQ